MAEFKEKLVSTYKGYAAKTFHSVDMRKSSNFGNRDSTLTTTDYEVNTLIANSEI